MTNNYDRFLEDLKNFALTLKKLQETGDQLYDDATRIIEEKEETKIGV